MKTKWLLKVVSSLVVVALVLSTASFASAKGLDNKKTEQKNQVQKEDKSSKNKGKKEKPAIKSKAGITLEKRINSVDSSIKNITKSIDSFFGVTENGTTSKELSKTMASEKYNSYKGKLNAEMNKLRAIDKQLAQYKKKRSINSSEFDALVAKSKELQQLAANEIKRVKSLAEQASAPKPEEGTTDKPTDTTTPTEPTNPAEPTQPTQPGDTASPVVPAV